VSQKTRKDAGGDLAPARRHELLDQLRGVMEDAHDGDEKALSKVRQILKERPAWRGSSRTSLARPNAAL
jgi:hypothetical protein